MLEMPTINDKFRFLVFMIQDDKDRNGEEDVSDEVDGPLFSFSTFGLLLFEEEFFPLFSPDADDEEEPFCPSLSDWLEEESSWINLIFSSFDGEDDVGANLNKGLGFGFSSARVSIVHVMIVFVCYTYDRHDHQENMTGGEERSVF